MAHVEQLAGRPEPAGAWRMLALVSVAELLAMTVWFSATAIAPQLASEWHLTSGDTAWLTMPVQAGFVAGTLISAVLNLPDVMSTRVLFCASAIAAAVANGCVAATHGLAAAAGLRFLTGVTLGGVYPPGMKIIAGWFGSHRGTALGILIGALTAGTATPHLLRALAIGWPWRPLMLLSSAASVLAGAIVILLVRDGPFVSSTDRFDPAFALYVFRERRLRLANLGYLGHMWELYAMWTWVAAFLAASFARAGDADPIRAAAFATFFVVAAGLAGSTVAGVLADRLGRPTIAAVSLLVSGSCAIGIGMLFGRSPAAVTAVAIVWGTAVVADSAQFSALVSEFSPRTHVGTALTVQTCTGFLLTLVTIRLVPALVPVLGWQMVFVPLAAGPAVGIFAMGRLRAAGRQPHQPA